MTGWQLDKIKMLYKFEKIKWSHQLTLAIDDDNWIIMKQF